MSLQVKQGHSTAKRIKRLVAAPFVLLGAIIILLEDWLWDDLAGLAAVIGRLPIFHQIEARILAAASKRERGKKRARLFFAAAPFLSWRGEPRGFLQR